MSELKILNEGVRYSHGTVGSLSGFDGKVFVKDGLKETSCEISFGMLAPGQMVPFIAIKKTRRIILCFRVVGFFRLMMMFFLYMKDR